MIPIKVGCLRNKLKEPSYVIIQLRDCDDIKTGYLIKRNPPRQEYLLLSNMTSHGWDLDYNQSSLDNNSRAFIANHPCLKLVHGWWVNIWEIQTITIDDIKYTIEKDVTIKRRLLNK